MRKGDLHSGAALIRTGLQHVEQTWQKSSDQWNDVVSHRFREEYLDPLVPEVKLALDTIASMQLLLDQIHRECAE